METKNNYAPKTKLYAPFELLKRILLSRESVAPEELEEYDRFMGSKDALGSEYAELLKKKKEAYPDYRKARDEMQELMKAQKNVEMFFAEEKDTAEKEQAR